MRSLIPMLDVIIEAFHALGPSLLHSFGQFRRVPPDAVERPKQLDLAYHSARPQVLWAMVFALSTPCQWPTQPNLCSAH